MIHLEAFQKFKDQFNGKKVTIMGLGLLGRGVGDARFFAQCGADVLVTDLKSESELIDSIKQLKKFKNIEFVLGEHREQDFANADIVIKGNNVPLNNKYIKAAEKAGVRVAMSVTLFAKYAQELGATVVGVTGTRGKTTVTNMIYNTLKLGSPATKSVYLAGNVRGMSTIELASEIKEGDILILELDSWILQGFAYEQFSPHIAVFTNFYPDHLNYYNNMDEYFADKANIYKYQKDELGDVLIVGEQVVEYITNRGRTPLRSGTTPIREYIEAVGLPSDWELRVPGEHNRYNAGIAREVLQQLGMTDIEIKDALAEFTGVEGRLEYMGEFGSDKVKIYNDNNATTPEATIAGINALANGGNIILIAGGTDKGTELNEVAKIIEQKCSSVHLLEGSGTDRLAPLLSAPSAKCVIHNTFKETVQSALTATRANDTVLFSPLFSSFGKEFVNEYDRNDKFKQIIKNYYEQ